MDVPLSSSKTFRLSFHGQTTEPLSFYQEDPSQTETEIKPPIKTGSLLIEAALLKLSSIGFANYRTQGQGVFVYGCRFLRANETRLLQPVATRSDNASISSEERDAREGTLKSYQRVIPLCPLNSEAAVRDRTFYVEFANHLGGADVNQMDIQMGGIIPSTAGTITTVENGDETFEVQTQKNQSGEVVATALIDGYSSAAAFTDLMADINDAAGKLHFRPGISMEPLKMALALNYTKADVENVVKLYSAMDQAYARWGTARGFEGAAVELAVK